MLAEWVLHVVVPFYWWKGDIRNYGCCRAVGFLGHGIRVVERVLDEGFSTMVTVIEMQLGFVLWRQKVGAVFVFERRW